MTFTRIVFLDIDGVLNSHAYLARLRREGRPIPSILDIDPEAVRVLNRLVTEGGCDVVVSSTQRHGKHRKELQARLDEKGFVGRVVGRTPEWLRKTEGGIYAAAERGQEIQAWLDKAPDYGLDVGAFVILDDDADMAHLKSRLVKTSMDKGLEWHHVEEALGLLHEKMPLVETPDADLVATYAPKLRFTE